MDRRHKSRVELRLSCRTNTPGLPSEISGDTTENISRNGLLLRWTRNAPVPDAGSALYVEVRLPSNDGFAPRVIRCDSTVVRILAGDDGKSRVALKVHTMRFVEDARRIWEGDVNAATPIQEVVN